jgi:N utilization substance protein B
MAGRRKERESALKIVFSNFFNHQEADENLRNLFANQAIDEKTCGEFCKNLSNSAIIHAKDFDEVIKSKLRNWTIERISIIDRIILRLALAEFKEYPDIPAEITINEMVELGKKFSTEEGKRFINGVLDNIKNDKK